MKLRFDLEPVAKGRPKTTLSNGMVRTYTPSKTMEAEKFIRLQAMSQITNPLPPETPLKLTASFYRCKAQWLGMKVNMPYKKPDLDNFLKLLLDALNGVAFTDDSQITTMVVKKRYTDGSKNLGKKKKRTPDMEGYIEVDITEDTDG